MLPSLALIVAKSYLEEQVFLNLASQIPRTIALWLSDRC